MPWGISTGGVCAIGSKIYIFGGGDYDSKKFAWETNIAGDIERFGARLLVFDTAHLDAGWKELSQCPGTTRMRAGMAAVDGKVYVLGGFAGSVDSWRYDPQTDKWERLRDLPVSCGGFGSGLILYKNRYILLTAGDEFNTVRNPDGTTRWVPIQEYGDEARKFRAVRNPDGTNRPGYGKASQVNMWWQQHPNPGLNGARFHNSVWIYDTRTNLYGTATNLPHDDMVPSIYIIGDIMYLFPSETGGFMWEGEYFGHQPEFVLKGKLKELDWQTSE